MMVARILGANVDLGKPADWDDARDGICNSLPVKRYIDEATGLQYWESAWTPTKEEMLAILSGGAVHLRIVGSAHPPVAVWAEAPTPDDDNPYGAEP